MTSPIPSPTFASVRLLQPPRDGRAGQALGWAALALAVFCIGAGPAFGQTLRTLDSFSTAPDASIVTGAAVAIDGQGNIYGTTYEGGAHGNGSIYRVAPSGAGKTIYSFTALANDGTNSDGAHPQSGLIAGSDGNFYGTAYSGGTGGNGTVFQVTPAGVFTALHDFSALDNNQSNTDGANPVGRLTEDPNGGTFYGTAYYGGPHDNGVVFQVTTGRVLTTLYSFADGADGANPNSGVSFGNDGRLYGVAQSGNNQDGVAFQIIPNGASSTFHAIHQFAGGASDASQPNGLTLGPLGKFYGSSFGGGNQNYGTIFQLTTAGSVNVLYSFDPASAGGSTNTAGLQPLAPLTLAPDGNFYGTAAYGGNGAGTIFQVSTSGALAVLYTFLGGTGGAHSHDGYDPQAPLTLSPSGIFYGTTSSGGNDLSGTLFRLTLPLPVNTFRAEAGSYIGQASGYFTITLTPTGAFTGKLISNHVTTSFAGALDAFGQYSGHIGSQHTPLSMQFSNTGNQATPGDYVMNGLLNGSAITAYHTAYDKGQTALEEGQYTLQFRASVQNTTTPGGTGYAAVNVSKSGGVSISGKLADGTPISFSGPLIGGGAGGTNRFLCFHQTAALSLSGFANFSSVDQAAISCPLSWTKSPGKGDYYAGGISTTLSGTGWHYNPVTASSLPPNFAAGSPNALLTLSDGGLAGGTISENFSLLSVTKNTDAGPNTADKIKLKIDRLNGVFSGSFVDPTSKKTISFSGALDPSQDGGTAQGYFLGPIVSKVGFSGKVTLAPE